MLYKALKDTKLNITRTYSAVDNISTQKRQS